LASWRRRGWGEEGGVGTGWIDWFEWVAVDVVVCGVFIVGGSGITVGSTVTAAPAPAPAGYDENKQGWVAADDNKGGYSLPSSRVE